MKIRFVATPASSRSLTGLTELLDGEPWWLSEEMSWQIELGAEVAPELRNQIRKQCERLAVVSSRVSADHLRMLCEVVGEETEVASASTMTAAPDAPKPRDVNGSAAHAALLKLLAFHELAEARPRFERVERAQVLSIVSGTSSEVRAGRAGDSEQSGWLVAARVSARGNQGAVWESARAVTCAGAAPLAIACPIAMEDHPDATAVIAWLERWIAASEAAAELRVPVIWIRADKSGEGVVAFGRSPQAGQLTRPFPTGAGERLVFLGETATEIAGSRYLAAVQGLSAGATPPTDPTRERKLHEVLQTLMQARVITAASSVGAGGLLVAACGMLLAGEKPLGARLDVTSLGGTRADALLFGEIPGRALVAVAPDRVGTVISEAHMHGVPAALIGEVTADPLLGLKTRSLATEWRVAELQVAWGFGAHA